MTAQPRLDCGSDWATYCRFRAGFAEALDARYYPIEWLDGLVETGKALVFGNDDAAIVAEIRPYPSGAKAAVGICAAGDLQSIISLIPIVEEWGREEGCSSGFIESREAWTRLAEPLGYFTHKVSVRKEL